MLETPHVIVAAAIAAKVTNPLLAIPLSFASHFLLDMTPHWNPHINTETKKYGKPRRESINIIIADCLLAGLCGVLIASSAPTYIDSGRILVCSFFGVLPDAIEAPHFFMGVKNGFVEKWLKFQKSIQNDTDPLPGLLTQVAVAMAALWWIFF